MIITRFECTSRKVLDKGGTSSFGEKLLVATILLDVRELVEKCNLKKGNASSRCQVAGKAKMSTTKCPAANLF